MALFNYTRDELTKSLRKMFGLRGDMGSRVETVLQPTYRVAELDRPPFHWYTGFMGGAVSGPAAGMTSHIGVSNTAPLLLVIDYIIVQLGTAGRVRLSSQGNGVPPSTWGFPNHDGTWDVNRKDDMPIVQFGGAVAAAPISAGATLAEVELPASGSVLIPGPFNMDPGGAQFGSSADFGQTLFLYSVAQNVRMCATFYGRYFDPTDMGIGR